MLLLPVDIIVLSLEEAIQRKSCQIACSVIEIHNKKHVIIKNFNNKKYKKLLVPRFLFITGVFYLRVVCIMKVKNALILPSCTVKPSNYGFWQTNFLFSIRLIIFTIHHFIRVFICVFKFGSSTELSIRESSLVEFFLKMFHGNTYL